MDKVQISVSVYISIKLIFTPVKVRLEKLIQNPLVMGEGHFKGNETRGQTSGNTVIMALKEHKFLLSSINKNP